MTNKILARIGSGSVVVLAALFLTLGVLSSCKKEVKQKPVNISGEWKLESFSSLQADDLDVDVYLNFTSGSFELFQKIGGGHFAKFSGTYTVTGNVLAGNYSNGSPFGSKYEVELVDEQLIMTSIAEASDENADGGIKQPEVCVYIKTAIPSEVRRDAEIYAPSKSSEHSANLPLKAIL